MNAVPSTVTFRHGRWRLSHRPSPCKLLKKEAITTTMDKKKGLDSVPHNLVEKCPEMFQSVDYSIHRFPVTVNTGLENCPVRWDFELRKAKWADVRTACLKDKLKFCFFLRPID